MINVNEKEDIRRAVLVDEKSQRQVARETGRSRNTIRKMLTDGEVPRYTRRRGRSSPVLGPYKDLLDTWIAEDQAKPKKKRRTAKRMCKLLRDEYGYHGAESTIRAYVGRARKKARHKVYVPLDYAPGEVAQVDFGEAEVIIAGELVVAQLFLMWLGYSSATFVKAYAGQTQEIFFDGLARGFEFFGLAPRQVWFDNLKPAVLKVLEGANRQEQAAFVAFRSHHLFEAHFCNVRAAWEKGGVEGRVGYSRRNWLIPPPEFAIWQALNDYLRTCCESEWERRLRGQSETIGERLAAEREHGLPLPERPYACCKTLPVTANHLALVSFDTNRYSVPVAHAHEALFVHAYPERIEIANERETVATHKRCWAREQDLLDPLHYLPLLERRPRAFEQSKAIRQWRTRWPEVFETYLAALREKLPGRQSTATFIRILRLCEEYAEPVLADALQQALDCHCYSFDGVRELVRRVAEPAPAAPLELPAHPALAAVEVSLPDLQQFNRLLSTGGVS